MPNIRPIKDLRDTSLISDAADIFGRLSAAEKEIENGSGSDGAEVLKEMREKYHYDI